MDFCTVRGRLTGWSGLSLTILLVGGFSLMRAHAIPGVPGQPIPTGKITPWAVIKIATAGTPGKPVLATYEYGDNKWTYGVVIANGKHLHEVEFDATTGKVGDTETITPEEESSEVAHELNAEIDNRSAGARPEGKEADDNE
jgi:hypothetical protein